jgi:penicillin-binding protein 1A
MQDVLQAVVGWGTGRAADIGRPQGGKTGTANDYRDAWYIGFTAELVTGIWLGNDDNTPMTEVTGGRLPARLWAAFMTPAVGNDAPQPLPRPTGSDPQIVAVEPDVDSDDGIGSLIQDLFGGSSSEPTAPASNDNNSINTNTNSNSNATDYGSGGRN